MKVVWFIGNLGNQIFDCAFIKRLQEENPNDTIYCYHDSKIPITVDKYFDLDIPPSKWYINILSFIVFRILGVAFRRVPLSWIPKFYSTDKKVNYNATFFAGFWQNKTFYSNFSENWLHIKAPRFINDKQKNILNMIVGSQSVCIHVRRGDYVKPGSVYYDLSSSHYYEKAIIKAKTILPDCKIFIFSDDIVYARNRFKDSDFVYVDCNDTAFLDLYFMSYAKINIIANSTFSFWTGYINCTNKYVIYPKQWFTYSSQRKAPDIMLESWIEID